MNSLDLELHLSLCRWRTPPVTPLKGRGQDMHLHLPSLWQRLAWHGKGADYVQGGKRTEPVFILVWNILSLALILH